MSSIPRLSDVALWTLAHRHYPDYDSDTVMSIARELEQARAELKVIGEWFDALESANEILWDGLARIQGDPNE